MKLYLIQNRLVQIIVLMLLSGIYCYGQDVYYVNGKVFVEDTETNDITIILIDNSSSINLPVTSSSSFSAKLKWDKKYYFKFMKSGYVTKIIEFSTFIPNGHTHKIEPYSLNVKLFPVFEGVDKVFFKKPVAKVYFDTDINDFTDDRDYALQVVYAINQMRKNAGNNLSSKKRSTSLKSKNTNSEKELLISSNKAIKSSSNVDSVRLIKVSVKQKQHSKYLLPPLKKEYSKERTVEEFDFDDKHITRVIIKENQKQCVYYRVKHNWGGVYYFIDESPLGIFSVTIDLFERKTNIFNSRQISNNQYSISNNQ